VRCIVGARKSLRGCSSDRQYLECGLFLHWRRRLSAPRMRRPHRRNRDSLRVVASANTNQRAVAADVIGPREAVSGTVFTAVIYGIIDKIWDPEASLRGKRICVTGQISDYKVSGDRLPSEPVDPITRGLA